MHFLQPILCQMIQKSFLQSKNNIILKEKTIISISATTKETISRFLSLYSGEVKIVCNWKLINLTCKRHATTVLTGDRQ